jgi:spore cortex formation protein SpoVR/YcgB (stage V sporulation)
MKTRNFTEEFLPTFKFWDVWLRTVFKGMGGDPYDPYYRFAANEEIGGAEAFIGFPVYPGMWFNGRQFIDWMRRSQLPPTDPRHANPAYEMILNTALEAYTYMRRESNMALNCLIIGHANCGHAHVFKNNRHLNSVGADTIMERMARYASRFRALADDPEFGIDRLEYTADAALVLADYCQESDKSRISNKALRKRLESDLRSMQSKRKLLATGLEVVILDRQIRLLTQQLKRDPINRVLDIGTFILDPEQNPGLSEKEREVIEIIFDVARYFKPQRKTKFINEGFAEFIRMLILNDPQTCLPPSWRNYLAVHFDGAFESNPTSRYDSPYYVSRFLFERLYAATKGDGHLIKVPIPVFTKVANPRSEANKLRALQGEQVQDPLIDYGIDPTSEMIDDEGYCLALTGEWRTIEKPAVDLKGVFDAVNLHDDLTFFHMLLSDDALQELHDKSLRWIDGRIRMITRALRGSGWNRNVTPAKMPRTLDAKLKLVMSWITLAENSDQIHEAVGSPHFPALPTELTWMQELLIFISAYQENRKKFRERHIAKLTLDSAPDISVIDGGVDSANGRMLVLEHRWDALTGQLLEPWARKAIQLLPRIWKQGGVKLITYKDEIDEKTGECKNPRRFIYEVNAKGELSEYSAE